MLRVGLTGGIATGKSTVAAMLRERDIPVLEADPIAHELLEVGQPAYDEVVREFGSAVLGPGGKVDRAKLGAIVFADATKRQRLNQILHPRILEVVRRWFESLDRPGGPEAAVVSAALIYEAGSKTQLDRVIVCWCRPEQQVARLKERGLTGQQIEQRIAAQMPIDEKRRLADDVIDCSGTIEATERQADQVVAKLKQLATAGRNIS